MTGDALGYIVFSLFAAIAFLSVVMALAVVGLALRFWDEPDPAQRVGLRVTICGDAERGQ